MSKSGAPDLVKNLTNLRRREEQQRRQKTAQAVPSQNPERCTECDTEIRTGSVDEWAAHYNENHPQAVGDQGSIARRIQKHHLSKNNSRGPAPQTSPDRQPDPKLPPAPADFNSGQPPRPTTTEPDRPPTSPPSNPTQKRDGDDKATPYKRSRARGPTHTTNEEFRREHKPGGKLWNPDDTSTARRDSSRQKDGGGPDGSNSSRTFEPRPTEPDHTEVMMKQPETRPISQEQLVAEVKGIYAGLVMVESKCIEVDNAQSSTSDDSGPKLNNEQWQALIALHRTLLHEHHDFFLASQHPSASPALRRLAAKYAMPARMWRHGIHSFLELLRQRLPESLEHMLTFIYLAYSMMALLFETVPAFEETWIECLGDLGRYRMAIEDRDIELREVWTKVGSHWYSKASDKAPTTGRLYHHLAILARPDVLQQLFYYTKSLCVSIPFLSARESIMTLFEPHLSGAETGARENEPAFIRAHGILFSGRSQDKLASSVNQFIETLDFHIARTTEAWIKSGRHIGIAMGCALLEYGSESNVLMRHIKSSRADDADVIMEGTEAGPSKKFLDALDFAARTQAVVFSRVGDPNIATYVHVTLSFLHHMSHYPSAMAYIENKMEWRRLALLLNTFVDHCTSLEKAESDKFPSLDRDTPRPLPDDFAQRGLLWTDRYYPSDWFTAAKIDEEEKYREVASLGEERRVRCLWLGCRLASSGTWLTYDRGARRFWVAAKYGDNPGEASCPQEVEGRQDGEGDLGIPDAPVVDT